MRRWIGRLRRVARPPENRSEGRALILLYHRVAEPRSDPWSLAVTPGHFAEHLEVLQRHARPMRLQQLSQLLLNENNLPDRSVVVTFDDGYVDNLHNAKPVLERYNVPATFFLASGLIGQKQEFWWDELDRLLLQPGALPASLKLSVDSSTYRWDLGEEVHCSGEAPSSRHSLYYSLWELLRPMTEGQRGRVLRELQKWAGAAPEGRSSYLPLSLEEAVTLAQGGLAEVGAHTVTHPALSTLSTASQRDEISGSKTQLEELLDHPITDFSYPYGSLSAETVSIVRGAGFACGCATHAGLIRQPTNPFQLPRRHIQDWDGDKFAKRLSRWFDG